MSQQSLLDETALETDIPSLPGTIMLNIRSLNLTEEQFELLCRDNRDQRIELTAQGELVIMSPTGMKTGWRNSKLNYYFMQWTLNDRTGICCDSSTLFTLRQERVDLLTEKQQDGFAPICPDFVLELRSPSDTIAFVQRKMDEYMANGAQLGWMIDPFTKRVYIYRPQQPVECLEDPDVVAGDPLLPGFVLNVREIW